LNDSRGRPFTSPSPSSVSAEWPSPAAAVRLADPRTSRPEKKIAVGSRFNPVGGVQIAAGGSFIPACCSNIYTSNLFFSAAAVS